MSDLVRHLNPPTMHKNPAFSQGVSVAAGARTVYIGGQNGVDAEGKVVSDDLGKQTEQAFANLTAVMEEAGGTLHDIIKWTIYVAQGQDIRPGLAVFGRAWGDKAPPPAITVIVVPAFARPEFLLEIEAIAVVADRGLS